MKKQAMADMNRYSVGLRNIASEQRPEIIAEAHRPCPATSAMFAAFIISSLSNGQLLRRKVPSNRACAY